MKKNHPRLKSLLGKFNLNKECNKIFMINPIL